MKKIIIITDGDDIRAFQLTARHGDRGLDFRTSEIPVRTRESERHSADLIAHALFSKDETHPPARRGRPQPDTAARHRSRHQTRPGNAALGVIARRIENIIHKERPDLWNLVAPDEICEELHRLLNPQAKEQLTCVQRADLLAITADQVEERFHPAGYDHP